MNDDADLRQRGQAESSHLLFLCHGPGQNQQEQTCAQRHRLDLEASAALNKISGGRRVYSARANLTMSFRQTDLTWLRRMDPRRKDEQGQLIILLSRRPGRLGCYVYLSCWFFEVIEAKGWGSLRLSRKKRGKMVGNENIRLFVWRAVWSLI